MTAAPNPIAATAPLNRVIAPALDGRTPIVLIHGVGSNLTAWDAVAGQLAEDAPVVRYDLRGHGRSPLRELPYHLKDLVDDHLDLLAELGIERAHLVGFSLGGLVAQAIAIAAPRSVDHLVMIGAVAGRTADERATVLTRLATLRSSGDTPATNAERWFTTDFMRAHPERVAANLARQAAANPVGYAAAYEVLATNDLADELHRVTAPTLAMTGEYDVGSPPHMAQTIANTVSDCRAIILPGVKHAVLDEIPDRVATEIAKFITTPDPEEAR